MSGGTTELVGAWRLVSGRFEPKGGEPFDMYGPNPDGRLVAGADYLSVLITMPNAPMPGGGVGANLLAYSGRYRVEGGQLITTVDLASVPHFIGTEQARDIQIDGEQLYLRTPVGPHPASPGKPGSGVLTLRREA